MGDYSDTDAKKIRRKVSRALQPWVAIYRHWPDGELLIRSLLKGAESRLAEKLGEITHDQALEAMYSEKYEYRAFANGRRCVDKLKV